MKNSTGAPEETSAELKALLNVPSRPIKQKITLKRGRKSTYSEARADAFCTKIAQGYSLADICGKDGHPAIQQVYEWSRKYPEFKEAYERAIEERGMLFGHKLSDLAEAVLKGEVDPQAARVAGDFYKFTAARLCQRLWGDKQEVSVKHSVSEEAAAVLMALSQRAKDRQIEDQRTKIIDVTPDND